MFVVWNAACPTRIRSEMQTVFRGVDTSKLLIIPTCQHSVENLVQMGEKIEDEKDRLLIAVSVESKLDGIDLASHHCKADAIVVVCRPFYRCMIYAYTATSSRTLDITIQVPVLETDQISNLNEPRPFHTPRITSLDLIDTYNPDQCLVIVSD